MTLSASWESKFGSQLCLVAFEDDTLGKQALPPTSVETGRRYERSYHRFELGRLTCDSHERVRILT